MLCSLQISLVIALVILGTVGTTADEFIDQASVIDGDTIEIHGERIRLWGIDAPESAQL